MIAKQSIRDEDAVRAFLAHGSDEQLAQMVVDLKAATERLDDGLREQVLGDVERIQDELDRRADLPTCWAPGDHEHDHEMCIDSVIERREESYGRHQQVEADDRPTQRLPRIEEQPAIPSSQGQLSVPDQESAERLLAAIKGETAEDVFDDLAAEQTAEWDALEADLGDERSWWHRHVAPRLNARRRFVLTVVVTVVVTWGAAWLVMGR